MKASIGLLVVLAFVAGCTTKGAYESVRQSARRDCETLPDTERARCLEPHRDDYETYRRKREEVTKSSPAVDEASKDAHLMSYRFL